MQRFYLDKTPSGYFASDHPLYHQLTRVLRSRVGDEFAIFGTQECDHLCSIDAIDKKGLSYSIIAQTDRSDYTPLCAISILQALPNKPEKLEYLIQKGIECGVKKFVFFPSRYSQPQKLDLRKKDRYTRIAHEAMEQCGRADPISLEWCEDLSSTCHHADGIAMSFVTSTLQAPSIASQGFVPGVSYAVYVGPEGGWSSEELIFLTSRGAREISFGARILRTETVSSVATFYILQHASLSSIEKSH